MSAATIRNIAIIAVLALAIVVVPGGSAFASTVVAVISLAFLAAIGWFGYRFYMSNKLTLWGMGLRDRAVLYGALAVAFMTLVASSRLWATGAGTIIWIALLVGSALAVVRVWTEARRYGV